MRSRFMWLLIFVCLNIVILLSLGTFYQWVPVAQWSVLSYFIILMAMVLLLAVVYNAFILPGEVGDILPRRDESGSDQPRQYSTLHSQALRRADIQLSETIVNESPLSEPASDIKSGMTAAQLSYLEANISMGGQVESEVSRDSSSVELTSDSSTLSGEPVIREKQGHSNVTRSDTVHKEPDSGKDKTVVDATQVLVSVYRDSDRAELLFPIHSYVGGAYLPGTLMDHDPGETGTQFVLTREPDNALESQAIRVRERSGNRIGFIPRPLNRRLAVLMDQGQEFHVSLIHKQQVCQSLRLDIEISLKD